MFTKSYRLISPTVVEDGSGTGVAKRKNTCNIEIVTNETYFNKLGQKLHNQIFENIND